MSLGFTSSTVAAFAPVQGQGCFAAAAKFAVYLAVERTILHEKCWPWQPSSPQNSRQMVSTCHAWEGLGPTAKLCSIGESMWWSFITSR